MTANLTELLAAGPPPTRRNGCKVCDWLKTRTQDDRDAIDAAWASGQWNLQSLYRVLRDQGLDTSDHTFRSHIDKKHPTSPSK